MKKVRMVLLVEPGETVFWGEGNGPLKGNRGSGELVTWPPFQRHNCPSCGAQRGENTAIGGGR